MEQAFELVIIVVAVAVVAAIVGLGALLAIPSIFGKK
jgi:hypothetical protein